MGGEGGRQTETELRSIFMMVPQLNMKKYFVHSSTLSSLRSHTAHIQDCTRLVSQGLQR